MQGYGGTAIDEFHVQKLLSFHSESAESVSGG